MTRRDFIRALQGTAVLAFMPATVARIANDPIMRRVDFERALENALIQIWNACDIRGIPMYIEPREIIVSPAGQLRIRQIEREEMYYDQPS